MSKKKIIFFILLPVIIIGLAGILIHKKNREDKSKRPLSFGINDSIWIAPDTSQIPHAEGDLIRYRRSLIANTSYFLGPHGKVAIYQMK